MRHGPSPSVRLVLQRIVLGTASFFAWLQFVWYALLRPLRLARCARACETKTDVCVFVHTSIYEHKGVTDGSCTDCRCVCAHTPMACAPPHSVTTWQVSRVVPALLLRQHGAVPRRLQSLQLADVGHAYSRTNPYDASFVSVYVCGVYHACVLFAG